MAILTAAQKLAAQQKAWVDAEVARQKALLSAPANPMKTALTTYAQGAGIVNPTAAQQLIIDQQQAAYKKSAGYVAPTPTVGTGEWSAEALAAAIAGQGGTTTPAATPAYDWQSAFNQYQQSATKAASNVIDADMAQANSVLNSGGIWKTLQPIANQQMQDSLAVLEKTSAIAKANVAASKAALDTQEAADYQEIIDILDKNLVGARQRTTEDMNARGMFFSTVLDSVMGQVEAASTTEKGHAAGQSKARYAKIASDMAVMTGNIDIEVLKGNASAVAQYTAQMLEVVAQDEQTKQEMAAIVAKLSVQKAGVIDAVAAQVFATGQQMQATDFSQQAQLRGEATDAANTAFTQNLQTNAAAADATATAQQQFVSTIGQYSGDYQAAINALDPNEPDYAFKLGMLKSDQQAKIVGIADQARKDFLDTINQYAGDFQSQINKIANDGNTSNDWELPYLKVAKMQKVSDQLVAQAESDAVKAKADALALYQSNQLDLQWFNATTQRINAAGSATGTTKAYAPSTAKTGTAKAPPNVWTHAAAVSQKQAYEKVVNMAVGTTIDASIAQDPNIVGSGVILNIGDTWTEESKAAYISANKGLYDSAVNSLNIADPLLDLNPNNTQLNSALRAVLQGMINQGIPVNMENLKNSIYEGYYIAPKMGDTSSMGGAEYDFLMAEYNKLPH